MKNLQRSIPDFSKDPRRLKKAKTALDLCYKLDLSPRGSRSISAKTLRKILGNQSNPNSFAAYLYTLFNQVGYYSKSGGTTYDYQTVPHRVQRLEKAVGAENGFHEYAESHGKSFKVAIPRSEYKITDDRHYAWWTSIRKEVRQKLFVLTHGVLYDYDIEAAKATVQLQVFNTWMLNNRAAIFQQSDACRLPMWSELVYNRKAFRRALAEEVGITEQQAKGVCQSVTNSAFAAPHKDNGICQIIGTDATRRLMENEKYKGLRADFQTMWNFLRPLAGDKKAGEFFSALYNRHERQIMDAVDEIVSADKWYVHDGFMTNEKIDVNMLAEKVREKTGLNIKFEENIFSVNDELSEIDENFGGENEDEQVSTEEEAGDPYNIVHKYAVTKGAGDPYNVVHKSKKNSEKLIGSSIKEKLEDRRKRMLGQTWKNSEK